MFQPTAADSDLQTLRYAIINKPTWATFDAATGRLSGTPPKGSAGAYANVGISVTDGASTASLASFTITVAAAANAAPQIMGTPTGSVQVGQVYDFVPAAADADGDSLRFAIVNAPSWATFDATTGRLTGKPQAGNEGPYADIVISVSDGKLFGFLPPFTITVAAAPVNKPVTPTPNSPPTISGTAPTGAVEVAAYAFQPSASDADGDALTYSASNLPAWLAINAGTGRVSGVAAGRFRRHVLRCRRHRLGRQGVSLAAGILDQRHEGSADQRAADDHRLAANRHQGRAGVFVPGNGLGRRRRRTLLRDRQQAGVAQLQLHDRAVVRARPRTRRSARTATSASPFRTASRLRRCRRSRSPSPRPRARTRHRRFRARRPRQ